MFLTGRREAPLRAAKASIEASGGVAEYAQVDVTDPKSVQAGVDAAVKRFGKIDIVIANAGKANDEEKSTWFLYLVFMIRSGGAMFTETRALL